MSLSRFFGVWTLLAVLMIANGALRELALVPLLGRSVADVTSAATGIAIILLATRAFFPPLADMSTEGLLIISLSLMALTVLFEFIFGHYAGHKSWAELGANYAVWRGRLWPIVTAGARRHAFHLALERAIMIARSAVHPTWVAGRR